MSDSPLILYATSEFVTQYNKLLKNHKKYGCLPHKLFATFYAKKDEELFELGYPLNNNNPIARLMKPRIDSCGNNGKSGGFRLISFVNKTKGEYNLLMVYPKWGPSAKSNADKDERKSALELYKLEKGQGLLYSMDFNLLEKTVAFLPKQQ